MTHLSYGQAYADGSQVVLLPEFPVKPADDWDEALLGLGPAKYVPVKWDGAHYLVSENDLKNFFDLNAGRVIYTNAQERPDAVFFVKDGDTEDHDSLNDVIVPRGYEKLIRKPINASIIKVGKTLTYHEQIIVDPKTLEPGETPYDDKMAVTSVVVNAGSTKGVKVGMSFHALSSKFNESVEITQVFKNYSIGHIERQIDDEADNDPDSQISVGWKLTTFRLYW